jgi:TolA-binding protein
MKITYFASFFIIFLFLVSCRTREQIAREQLVDNIAVQLKDGQELSVDFTTRLSQIEEKIGQLTGQVEESNHETKSSIDKRLVLLEEKIILLEANSKSTEEKVTALSLKSEEQSKYLKEVLGTLKKLSGGKSSKSRKKLNPYDLAMSSYRKGHYKTAKKQLLGMVGDKKIKGNKKARIIHNLGMISFINKKDKDALSYFSLLFTEHPKAPYNKNGLLFLGKTFLRLGKGEEAKQTLNELITRFPKAKQVKEAKKLIKKIKV